MSGKRIPSRWKVKDPFNPARSLVRMSWNKLNTYVLATKKPVDFGRRSVFQQKWIAKRELRAYHVPNITEDQLLKRHWKSQLPLRQLSMKEQESLPPVQALAFGELERRLDVVVFRSHFASSIFEARTAVVHGHVKVNGEKCPYPARRLLPGDMVTINPNVVTTLIPKKAVESESKKAEAAEAGASEAKNEVDPTAQTPQESNEVAANAESTETSSEGYKVSNSGPEEAVATADAKAESATTEAAKSATGEAKQESKPKQSQTDILAAKHPNAKRFHPQPYMAPWMFIPAYLEVCYNTCSTIFLRTPLPQPNSVEIPSPHAPDMHSLAYEWYSRIKGSKTKRPPPADPLVVNGQSVRLKAKFDSIVRARLKQERDDKWDIWAKKEEEERVKALAEKMAKVVKTEKANA
ncbi:hypothetical protein BC830DRAFT_1104373 [Chytriomyces sp. MP71]|nr:hypothetical protein BC830DRAFT_1104373 [Chytriomyces sp. MP71]